MKNNNIKKIETDFGEVEIFFKESKRSNGIKLKIDSRGDIFLIFKKQNNFLPKIIKNFNYKIQEKILINFVKKNAKWIFKNRKKILNKKKENSKINVIFSREEFLKEKESLRKLAKKRILYFNEFYNFSFNKIFIKNQKTRWGSCSSKKNLNFNISILKLPKELQDLIFVHEMCHLKEMNHSEKFWDLVEKKIPNYKELNKELKKYSIEKFD